MIDRENATDSEPPATSTPTEAADALAERVMAVSHAPASAHVAVIGRHILPYVLALMQSGCGGVRSLRPDAAAPDCEPADLTWIVDCRDDRGLDGALRAARRRAGARGRVVVEGAACRSRRALSAVRERASMTDLDIVSFDHATGLVVLAPAVRQAMAA